MFIFLPLINNSVTIGLSLLLLSKSAMTSSKTINILHFLFGLYSYMFTIILKALQSLAYFVPTSSRLLIKD